MVGKKCASLRYFGQEEIRGTETAAYDLAARDFIERAQKVKVARSR